MEVRLIKYEVVYSINSYNFSTFTYVLIGVLILALIITASLWRIKKGFNWKAIAIGGILLIFSIAFFIIYNHYNLVNDLNKNNCKIEEGQIESFSPASDNVKGIESFSINNISFKYASLYDNGGLNHSISSNSLIHNGAYAKVYYEDDNSNEEYKIILRIEVKKN